MDIILILILFWCAVSIHRGVGKIKKILNRLAALNGISKNTMRTGTNVNEILKTLNKEKTWQK